MGPAFSWRVYFLRVITLNHFSHDYNFIVILHQSYFTSRLFCIKMWRHCQSSYMTTCGAVQMCAIVWIAMFYLLYALSFFPWLLICHHGLNFAGQPADVDGKQDNFFF